jgi:predicted nucleotidyltransferase
MNDKGQMRDLIQEIVQRIVACYAPQKVILFGSYAYGEPNEDSDLDFLVIMDTTLPPSERYVKLRQSLGPLDIPVDIFVLTPEEFEETRDIVGGLAYAPAKYGQVIYEKS